MPALADNQLFGPARDPRAQVVIPHTVASGDFLKSHCFGHLTHIAQLIAIASSGLDVV